MKGKAGPGGEGVAPVSDLEFAVGLHALGGEDAV